MAATLVGCARSVLKLYKEIKDLESRLEKKKQAYQSAKESLLEMFQRNGLQATSTNTHSIFLTRQIWASLRSKRVGIPILKKHGLGWLIDETVKPETLSAWVRKQCPDETSMPKLPQELFQQIRVHEKFGISIRKR